MLSVEHLQALLLQYKYFLLFPLAIVEGPIVTLIAGFFISQGVLDTKLTYGLIVIGDEIGDILHYLLGASGGKPFVKKFGKFVGITQKELTQVERLFRKRGGTTVLLSKIAHGIGGVFQIGAGVVRMPISTFIGYTFVGTIIKAAILLLLGYYFGHRITTINSYLDVIGLIGFASIVGIGIWAMLRSSWAAQVFK